MAIGMIAVVAVLVGVVMWIRDDDTATTSEDDDNDPELDEFEDPDEGYELLVPEDL